MKFEMIEDVQVYKRYIDCVFNIIQRINKNKKIRIKSVLEVGLIPLYKRRLQESKQKLLST